MTHFSDEAWLNYVRRLLPADRLSRMQAHLESGCARCAERHALWETVHRTGSRLSEQEPPREALEAAKAIFAHTQAPREPFLIQVARLLFDSFASAPLAGVRSGSSTARHLLYQAESWTIDLRLDTEPGRKTMIEGQVLDSAAEDGVAAHHDIVLVRGDEELARTSTNDFGEFQLATGRAGDLEIQLEIPGQRPIRLKLPE
jgi:anti-sigma factor RsiW